MITSSSQLKIASTPTIESISLSSAASALYAGGADASAPAVAVAIARCLRTSVGAPRDCRATHGLAAFALVTSVLAMRGIHNNNNNNDNFEAPSRPPTLATSRIAGGAGERDGVAWPAAPRCDTKDIRDEPGHVNLGSGDGFRARST